jgi:hypothetical protein
MFVSPCVLRQCRVSVRLFNGGNQIQKRVPIFNPPTSALGVRQSDDFADPLFCFCKHVADKLIGELRLDSIAPF